MTDKTPEVLFAEALVKFQTDRPRVGKESKANAGTFSYTYAALPDVLDATLPALTACGLAFFAAPTLRDDGAFVLRYALMHEAGHSVGGDYPLPQQANPQQIGSAISYGRRYCFTAVTGIAPDEDDDGAKASEAHTSLPRAPRRPNATTRHTADTLPREDEWTTPLPVTDAEWLTGFEKRLDECTKAAEVRGLIAEAQAQVQVGGLASDDAKQLKAKTDARLAELGQPVGVS